MEKDDSSKEIRVKSADQSLVMLNNEFSLEKGVWTPKAIYEVYRAENLPSSLPTVIIHEKGRDIDLVGELNRLKSRCDSLSFVSMINTGILLAVGFLTTGKMLGVF